jgi:hypothetical protein
MMAKITPAIPTLHTIFVVRASSGRLSENIYLFIKRFILRMPAVDHLLRFLVISFPGIIVYTVEEITGNTVHGGKQAAEIRRTYCV